MANELAVSDVTGSTPYAVIARRGQAAYQAWNGSSWETWTAANWATYKIALTERGTASGEFSGTFPSTITAGRYRVLYYHLDSGGTAAETDPKIWVEALDWTGTVEVVQTGDSFARIGSAGAGLTALGDTRLANLDTSVSSVAGTISNVSANIGIAGVGLTSLGDIRLANLDATVSSRATASTANSIYISCLNTEAATITNGVVIADGAITAAKIASSAITSAKFSVSSPSGVASGILEKIDQIWRRFFKKVTLTGGFITTYNDAGDQAFTTQTSTDTSTTETQGPAT